MLHLPCETVQCGLDTVPLYLNYLQLYVLTLQAILCMGLACSCDLDLWALNLNQKQGNQG